MLGLISLWAFRMEVRGQLRPERLGTGRVRGLVGCSHLCLLASLVKRLEADVASSHCCVDTPTPASRKGQAAVG